MGYAPRAVHTATEYTCSIKYKLDLSPLPGVRENLASPVYGTPMQNTLAILEPQSKIRRGILAPCGAPLGELGTPRRYESDC